MIYRITKWSHCLFIGAIERRLQSSRQSSDALLLSDHEGAFERCAYQGGKKKATEMHCLNVPGHLIRSRSAPVKMNLVLWVAMEWFESPRSVGDGVT